MLLQYPLCVSVTVSLINKSSILYFFLRLVFDFSHIFWAFGDFSTVITLWMAMQAQALVIYPLFQFWIQTRRQANASGAVDVASFIVYTSYLLLFFYYPISMLATLDLPPASSIVVACEQVWGEEEWVSLTRASWAFVSIRCVLL